MLIRHYPKKLNDWKLQTEHGVTTNEEEIANTFNTYIKVLALKFLDE